MAKPVLGYPSRTDAIAALSAAGLSFEDIHERVGGSFASVRVLSYARQHRVSDRKVLLPRAAADSLADEASIRGTDMRRLLNELLDVIVRDDLFDALLGEPGHFDA